MTETICLDPAYSTTRMVSRETPVIENLIDAKFEALLILPESEGRKGVGGLRTHGYFKKSLPDKPLVTVVTVVFNEENHLEETILSVINQKYDNIEYIVIDGGSTDRTPEIIRKYDHVIDYWLSEKDHGIFDAMNKGISLAYGCWLNFMNAGDVLNGNSVFDATLLNNHSIDILYSDTLLRENDKLALRKSAVERKSFIHQSLIYRKSLHNKFGYYLNLPNITISDYLFFLICWTPDNSRKILSPIAVYRGDGMSTNSRHIYQKFAVDLMCGQSTPPKIGLIILLYPLYKYLKSFFKKLC